MVTSMGNLAYLVGTLLVSYYASSVRALDHQFNHVRRQLSASEAPALVVPSYNFSMPLDHFNTSDTRTYNNRYWINDTYYRDGGPVFFYDIGESGITARSAAAYFGETAGRTACLQLAQHYNGMVIGWEHRYYGLSQPFPINITGYTILAPHVLEGGAESYKYLSNEQALEDLVYFAKRFSPPGYDSAQVSSLHPYKTPWIWLGGSYPGARGAWSRIRNPDIFYAVWASSAVVENTEDGSPYFRPIQRSLPSNCSNDVQAVVQYVDEVLSGDHGEDAYTYLQQLSYIGEQTISQTNQTLDPDKLGLNLSYITSMDPTTITSFASQAMIRNFQSLGPQNTTNKFCDFLQSFDPGAVKPSSNDTVAIVDILSNPGSGQPRADGLAAEYGPKVALNAYAYALRKYLFDAFEVAVNISATAVDGRADLAAYTWQSSTELGWNIGSNPENATIISKFYNFTTIRESSFMTWLNFSADTLPQRPSLEPLKYGGWDMQPSNVMFTDGEFDPWRSLGVQSQEQDLGAPNRRTVQEIPQCGEPPNGTDIFGLIYPGTAHVQDLRQLPWHPAEGGPLDQGLELFSKALDVWLPCFQPSRSIID